MSSAHTMRIISGQWRSRRLVIPKTTATRPMTDRVRESVFDLLGSRLGTPGRVPPIHVADVFAGGGSLGLEAMSRGARSCLFYENGKEALKALRANLANLKAGPALRVVQQDIWSRGLRGPGRQPRFDLVFLDPPYKDSRDSGEGGAVWQSLQRGRREHVWADDVLIVLHHEARVIYDEPSDGRWHVVDQRRYGSTGITCFQSMFEATAANGSTPSRVEGTMMPD